jgi:hypothetical protein
MARADYKLSPGQPNLGTCSARSSGFGDYVDCLSEDAYHCIHALKFGDGYLCFHPERDATVARTEASRRQGIASNERKASQL